MTDDTEASAMEWLRSFLADPTERLTLILCSKQLLDNFEQTEKTFGVRLALHCLTATWLGSMAAAIHGNAMSPEVARRIATHISKLIEEQIAVFELKKAARLSPEPSNAKN